MNEIQRIFEQEGHRLKAAMERLNEIGQFGGEVVEAIDAYGYELYCADWCASASFDDAHEMGDADEPGREANVTVFCVATGGRLLANYIPYNFTEEVWCDLRIEFGRRELLHRLENLEGCLVVFASDIRTRLGAVVGDERED